MNENSLRAKLEAVLRDNADAFWLDKATPEAAALVQKQEDLIRTIGRVITEPSPSGDTGPSQRVIRKATALAHQRMHRQFNRGASLYNASLESFDGLVNPQKLIDQDDDYAREAEKDGYDVPHNSMTKAQAGHRSLRELKSELVSIFDPERTSERTQALASSMADEIVGQFASQVTLSKAKLAGIADAGEREVEQQKIFVAAFESMVKQLPPAFVYGILNPQLEADANEAGYDVRMKPDSKVEDVTSRGRTKDSGKERGAE